MLEVFEPSKVAQLAAHDPSPLIRADQLAPKAERLAERDRLLGPHEPNLRRLAAQHLERHHPAVDVYVLRPGRKPFEQLERVLEGCSHAVGATDLEVGDAEHSVRSHGVRCRACGFQLQRRLVIHGPRLLEPRQRGRRVGCADQGQAVLLCPCGDELERAGEQAVSGRDVELHCPLPGEREEAPGAPLELGVRICSGRFRELERLAHVVGKKISVVEEAVARHLLEPVRSRLVLGSSRSARDLPVGDVADERMPEQVFGLALDRRQPGGAEELLAGQLVKALADLVRAPSAHGLEGACPEDLADDGSVLEQRFTVGGQRVEPRGDDALDRVRQRQVLCRSDLEE